MRFYARGGASAIDGFNLNPNIALTVTNAAMEPLAAGEAFNENFIRLQLADNFRGHGCAGNHRLSDFHAAVI